MSVIQFHKFDDDDKPPGALVFDAPGGENEQVKTLTSQPASEPVEVDEIALIVLASDLPSGCKLIGEIEFALRYAGQTYALDYGATPGARLFDCRNTEDLNDVVREAGSDWYKQAFALSLANGRAFLMSTGQSVDLIVTRRLGASGAHAGVLKLNVDAELREEVQVESRQVRFRRIAAIEEQEEDEARGAANV